jgi:oxalate decarboxylase
MGQEDANQSFTTKSHSLTRRRLLGAATLSAAGVAAASIAAGAQQETASPAIGRRTSAVAQNGSAATRPQSNAAPHHAHEPLQNFKFDVEKSQPRVAPGGTAKEVNVEQLPVSESIAGVSMRLKPGGLRELHWHAVAAEWAYVLKGNVRATVVAPNGQAESADFGPGDVWYFPKGHGHALQGLGPDEAHFILVFDNGHFSEYGSFSITDWIGQTPAHVLARNLGLPEAQFASLPKEEVYIAQGKVPPAIPEPFRNANVIENQMAHKYRLGASRPFLFSGGEQRVVTVKEFPIQTTMSAVVQELKVGGLREMHWHPNADEWQYYISGRARVTIFGAHGRSMTEEFEPGQVGFIKQGFGHYVEQIGPEPTRFLAVFNHPLYEEISISTWLGANPPSMIADNFGLSQNEVAKLPKSGMGIIG